VLDEVELRRIVWVFPDRESQRGVGKWQRTFWSDYAEVAASIGLRWSAHAPDDIAVDGLDVSGPRVYVAGEPVSTADTVFVTSLYSLPYQSQDVFNQYALYAVLEQIGFYLPAPPYLSAIVNDKLATLVHLQDSPIPPIPTVRIGTGRDLGHKFYEPVLQNLTFPAIVKPTGWCSGWGICMAHNVEDLRGLLSLAQGGETTLVCQPYLGAGTSDYRVYLVDGEVQAVLRRTPKTGAYVGNIGRGGSEEYVDLPLELAEAIPYFAKKIPIPFLCVDFLFDGERFWLSEIEPDGVISSPDRDSAEDMRITLSLMQARFEAYRRGHARWIAVKGR
jgi:glutathione synthase/RimK-type ligase-like ATP-grasp enzyme